jgi:hypothetical protein
MINPDKHMRKDIPTENALMPRYPLSASPALALQFRQWQGEQMKRGISYAGWPVQYGAWC